MEYAAKALNADGFRLLDRLNRAEPAEKQKLIALIDRVAFYARTKKHIEVIEYGKLMADDKVFAEAVTARLMARLLENLT